MPDLHLDSYIKQLAIDVGMPEIPAENEKGIYFLDFGKDLNVLVGSLQPGFSFFAKLGTAPGQNSEDFFSILMQANLFGQGTGGGIIGLDEEGKVLTLSHEFPYPMPYQQFKEHIEEFINYVDLWQKKTTDASASSAQRPNHVG